MTAQRRQHNGDTSAVRVVGSLMAEPKGDQERAIYSRPDPRLLRQGNGKRENARAVKEMPEP